MATDFSQAKELLKWLIDDDGASSDQQLTRFLNLAHRDAATARDWPELVKRAFVQTGAPYTTGTVSVSQNGTAVTGVGTAWDSQAPALDAGYKFGVDYQDPFYPISSIDSDTGITLDGAYAEADVSGGSYVLYRDTVSMPSRCNKIYQVWVHDEVDRIELTFAEEWSAFPQQTGIPVAWTNIERDSEGRMQIKVGPLAPDKVYRIEISYRIDVAENRMAGDGGGHEVLREERFDVVLQRALYWAFRRDSAAAARELAVYKALLEEEWDEVGEGASEPLRMQEQRVRPLDGSTGDNYRGLEL